MRLLYRRTIYRELGGAVSEDQQAIYQQRVDEIFPNVRYCAYNIGDTPADLGELLKLRSGVTGSVMLASKKRLRMKYIPRETYIVPWAKIFVSMF